MGKLQQPPGADAVAAEKAALREEFGGWSIIHTSDTGRWWATRASLVSEDLSRVEGATFDADTAEGLRAMLREATGAKVIGQ
ncbi:hypothetical protein [Actinomadura macra]|uniref:hypothetical protein n=1 Tax=Actinomadura macra TaxID=46164 RepID=UPI00082A61B4|nr:hypothetical protein [Actinomadura macra]